MNSMQKCQLKFLSRERTALQWDSFLTSGDIGQGAEVKYIIGMTLSKFPEPPLAI
jgi:hypothetical protein